MSGWRDRPRACVNYSSGSWYPRGQERLRGLLGSLGERLVCFGDHAPVPAAVIGGEDVPCPAHADVPYGFKPFALLAASLKSCDGSGAEDEMRCSLTRRLGLGTQEQEGARAIPAHPGLKPGATHTGPAPGAESPSAPEIQESNSALAIEPVRICKGEAPERVKTRLLLWLDASAVPRRPLEPVWEWIDRHGVFMPANFGWKCGQWTAPECSTALGLDALKYRQAPHGSALVCGFDLEHPIGYQVFAQWLVAAADGTAFRGPRDYPGEVGDRWPYGHRWDQSVLSLLLAREGIPLAPNEQFLTYGPGESGAVFAAYPA